MDNQHRKITGYRELSQEELDLINEIKAQGVALDALVTKLQQANFAGGAKADQRWVAIGKTDLQTGLMALTRSIAQPTSF